MFGIAHVRNLMKDDGIAVHGFKVRLVFFRDYHRVKKRSRGAFRLEVEDILMPVVTHGQLKTVRGDQLI